MSDKKTKASAVKTAEAITETPAAATPEVTKASNLDLIADLQAQITEKDVEIAALQTKLAEAITVTVEDDKPTYEGYAFMVDKFRFKGNKHTAVEAVKDADLMKELIASNFFGLNKVK